MNLRAALFLLATLSVSLNGQTSPKSTEPFDILRTGKFTFDFEKECGSPFAESQTYDFRQGRITKILAGNKVVFRQNFSNSKREKRTFIVSLAGVDLNTSETGRSFLIKHVLNQKMKVVGNLADDHDTHFEGILWGAGFGDINSHLIKNGMALFIEPQYAYSVSRYTLCTYEQLQTKAKRDHLGLWLNK